MVTEGLQLTIAPAQSDRELLEVIEVRERLDPRAAPNLAELRHNLATVPQLVYLVARRGGEPLGCAFAGGNEGEGHVRASVDVVRDWRQRGVGTALFRAISEHARSDGNIGFVIEVREDDPVSQAFVERRGYVEVERQKALVLDLRGLDPPAREPPPGIRIVTRAERPDVVRGMFEAAVEVAPDVPGLDGASVPTFEEWHAHEIGRPSRRPELAFVALDGDEVVGYASLDVFPGAVFHGLTAVRRAWRGRGIARALKLSQIAAAKAAGFEQLETESEERNVAMRRLNESLGYRPEPGMIVYKGPLVS